MSSKQAKAKEIVAFWKNRGWLQSASPVQVHHLDLNKLEELIVDALEEKPLRKRTV